MPEGREKGALRVLAVLVAAIGMFAILVNGLGLTAFRPAQGGAEALVGFVIGGLGLVTGALIWKRDARARWVFLAWGVATTIGHFLVLPSDVRGSTWLGYLVAGGLIVWGFLALSRASDEGPGSEA